MLDGRHQRGFTAERLRRTVEPRVREDEGGFYVQTLSENVKVYFDDYYNFLMKVHENCEEQMLAVEEKIEVTPEESAETLAYYRAKMIILNIVRNTAFNFYTDNSNFGVIMTPWCFGTVALEKIEVYRERLSRGEAHDEFAPDYPYYVIKYVDEICKATLLGLFDFPDKAFKMRWQYSELLRRYAKALGSINESLETVLMRIKNYQP
jgi:hypothetical protein